MLLCSWEYNSWRASGPKVGLFSSVILKCLFLFSSLKLETDILIAWKRNARKSQSKTKKSRDELKP